MSIYLRNILRFVLLILIQVLLLNNISLQWWANPNGFPPFVPFIYVLFIILLPINTPVWLQLCCGFFLGLSIDTFTNTGGIHAAASVLAAFCRTRVLALILPKKMGEYNLAVPSIETMGWMPFLSYTAVILFIHHLAFFGIELWTVRSPLYLFIKLFATLVTSVLFTLIYSLLFSKSINTKYREILN